MIHLEGYNCAICHTQLNAWDYVQTKQLYPPKWIITWSELVGNNDVNKLAEYAYWRSYATFLIFCSLLQIV